ncbi:MAG: hypothetical protein KDA91_07545 [Planctomycetaceae bacterium]|nr:hypothetical protein [Planctomycetaceae bacterium]
MPPIVPHSFLFEFLPAIPRIDTLVKKNGVVELPESSSVFVPSQLNSNQEAGPAPFQLRMAWNPDGLAVNVFVSGKKLAVEGRSADLKNSDYVSICIDTRHTADVHRATGYCTALAVVPVDSKSQGQPRIIRLEIAQQRDSRHQLNPENCRAETVVTTDGYQLRVWLPSTELPGFNEVAEIGRIGFYLVVHDSELGELPLSVGDDFPVSFDPSTWMPVTLVAEG